MQEPEHEPKEPEQGSSQAMTVAPKSRIALRPDTFAITDTLLSMRALGESIPSLLVENVDYGHVPGIPGKMLFDCGASKITNAFACYPGERRIISMVDDGSKISVVVEVPLVHRESGKVVCSGIGAASTLETKHKYRWIANIEELEAMGYAGDKLNVLKKKTDKEDGSITYRVPNPEHGELLNTIVKMASKRAEVDAAESLPAVGSTLKVLFDRRLGSLAQGIARPPKSEYVPPPGSAGKEPTDSWSRFWGEVTRMGLTREQVLAFFKTGSMDKYMTEHQKDHAALLYELRDAMEKGDIK